MQQHQQRSFKYLPQKSLLPTNQSMQNNNLSQGHFDTFYNQGQGSHGASNERLNMIMKQLNILKSENDELRSAMRHNGRCSLNMSGGLLAAE